MIRKLSLLTLLGLTTAAGITALPSRAEACGGFFCSIAQPVNQAAERIIFAKNTDGTVTAAIQIMYEGPAENFAWLLPISSDVPPVAADIGVASNLGFQRLQASSNPQYTLNTRVEGTCKGFGPTNAGAGGAATAGAPGRGPTSPPGDGVSVAASGVVGGYEFNVISVNLPLPAGVAAGDVAVDWLEANGYDVPPASRGILGPYLGADGQYLLALKLTKGSDVGSIRPIVVNYKAELPMIPLRPTALSANDDMPVMTWLLSGARGVPQNYLSLELNEAKINWFNASANYNDVVNDAANDARGQGFVTEFAGPSSTFTSVIWSSFDEQAWQSFKSGVFSDFRSIFDTSYAQWGQWDGFWDAVEKRVTLPAGLAFEDFRVCPGCYAGQVQFTPSAYIAELEKQVIEPVRSMQELIDQHDYVTRLYTTMSAEEMTADPVFTFNADLPDVSNIHRADRIIECSPDVEQFEAPWRIELPQGGVIRGRSSQVGSWPEATATQPANYRIVQLSDVGNGAVLENNSQEIRQSLDAYNSTIPGPGRSAAGAAGRGGASGGGMGGQNNGAVDDGATAGGGCAVTPRHAGLGAWALAGIAALVFAQRRRRAGTSKQDG